MTPSAAKDAGQRSENTLRLGAANRVAAAAKMSEDELTASVLELAALLGWRCYHARPALTSKGWRTAAQGNGAAGYPDLTLAHPDQGRVLFVELKSATGKIRPEQREWLYAIDYAAEVAVWRPKDWISGHVERVLRRERAKWAP